MTPTPTPLTALKRNRLERRIDRCKVAQVIGVSDKTLSRWEEAQDFLEEVVKLADFYGVSLDELVGRAPSSVAS